MDKIINLYKPSGYTLHQTIENLRKNYPSLQNQKVSYAGRLDPMAEGVLVVLCGNENKNRSQKCDLFLFSLDNFNLFQHPIVHRRMCYRAL